VGVYTLTRSANEAKLRASLLGQAKWSVGEEASRASAGNTKGGSITVLLTSYLTGLD